MAHHPSYRHPLLSQLPPMLPRFVVCLCFGARRLHLTHEDLRFGRNLLVALEAKTAEESEGEWETTHLLCCCLNASSTLGGSVSISTATAFLGAELSSLKALPASVPLTQAGWMRSRTGWTI